MSSDKATIETLREALRVALRYIETEDCGAPEGTIAGLRKLAYPPPASVR